MSIRTSAFIDIANKIHKNAYDYTGVIIEEDTIFIDVKCKTCENIFNVRIKNHIKNRTGCRRCNTLRTKEKKRMSTEEFVELAKQIHGDKFDYSKAVFVRSDVPMEIICRKCGNSVFHTRHRHLVEKCGCMCQRNSMKNSTEKFIEKSKLKHGPDTFDYSKTVYVNTSTKVIIICKSCGFEMHQRYDVHLRCKGCTRCNKNTKISTEEWIERARQFYGDRYDYSQVIYVSMRQKVTIVCPKHGSFETIPGNFFNTKESCVGCRKDKI
nr:F-box and FNIP repeat-containing [Megavirus caiporensis]